ncbi:MULTISPECIES: DUF1007 family protein [unclassified Thioalkalivibrio]|uniref:DUF1007 family protein n=1 Tax=unclassified Thioalkalivibrio TaxID=2621013 RepID=UPI0003605F40|nr:MULTISPECIES: DUF1007 family protein [unclassified Thioalkalivibrio]
MNPVRKQPRLATSLATFLLLAATAGLPGTAAAHPHAWIDLEVDFERDANGQLVRMHHLWQFDPMYSEYLHEDALAHQEGDSDAERLNALAREILDNLEEYDWYTHFEAEGHAIEVRPEGEARMEKDGDTLEYRFTLALEGAPDPARTPVDYRVFDPTYFIEILHPDERPPRVRGAPECEAEVDRPRPDPAMVARAMALDYGAEPEENLGRHFADRVTLRCD